MNDSRRCRNQSSMIAGAAGTRKIIKAAAARILKAAAAGTTKSRKKRIDESSSLRNQGKNDSRSCRGQK